MGIGRATLIVFSIATIFSIGLTFNQVFAGNNAELTTLFGVATVVKGNPSNLYSIDPITGAASLIGSIGFKSCSGIAIHPSTGEMFGACNTNPEEGVKISVLVSINTLTGAGSLIGETGIENLPINAFDISDLSFRPNGQLFGYAPEGFESIDNQLVTIDTITGAAAIIGPPGLAGRGNAIAWLPGDTLFHADDNTLSTLNPATGDPTFVALLTFPVGIDRISGMDFQPGTNILYGSAGGFKDSQGTSSPNLVTIDINPGAVAIVGDTGLGGLTGLAFVPAFVPIIIGGSLVPIDTTALLLAGVQSISMWMIPVVAAGIGIGIFVMIRRK